MPVEYVLREPRDRTRTARQDLDAEQQSVVDHAAHAGGGPLLVLAGPGTGKTTTLVEAVVERVEQERLSPDEVLVLTFSRKAADEIRGRIASRLARTTAATPAMTFHGFCYALLRAEQPSDAYTSPMRLLSAPEQDAAIAELLAGGDAQRWPAGLRPALRTRGMATELQRLMAAARAQDMDAYAVEDLGERIGRDDWAAAGGFFDEYTAVAALQNTIDHTDMIFKAVRLLDDADVRDRWRRRFRLVVVDEYQDTDPLQVALLRALAGDGRDLVAVGDPYQSIYGFRGSDARGIHGFRHDFGTPGAPAPVAVLAHTNRYGSTIGAAVRSIVDGRGAGGPFDRSEFDTLRSPASRVGDPGCVAVRTFATPTAEAEHLALRLRDAHLHDGVPWSDMAVLVRSGAHLTRLHRALGAAGVPVEVAGDEVPLAQEPSVRALLAALHAADELCAGGAPGPDAAHALLTGPLGGLDAAALRRLGRALRSSEPDRPRPSRTLIAEALADPRLLTSAAQPHTPEADAVAGCHRLATLLARAAAQIGAGESAEMVLWTLWDGTDWPRRLLERAESDADGSLQAHHDLDALCALFAEAARAEEQAAERSAIEVAAALEAQQIPADTLAQQGTGGPSVQLMTAHRAKGLQWPLVVVAGVQDGEWPDTRVRSSLLQVDRLSPDGATTPPSARSLVAEERRLFYVACSRAERDLLVTAVRSVHEDGDQPSRFVTELHAHVAGPDGAAAPTPEQRPRRGMSLRAVVAELRRIGETTHSEVVRGRAATQLATLAGHPAARGADPDRWWGLREITRSEQPLRDRSEPLGMSGSQVDSLTACPLRWFLDHEARGGQGTTAAQGFGSIVHAIAAEVVSGALDPDPAALDGHLEDVWSQLEHQAPWIGRRERAAATEAIERFCRWHATHGRQVLAAEHRFRVEHEIEGRTVTLNGSMDRVEVDVDGVHVVDLKTSKTKPSGPEVSVHPQLGFYQVAVGLGATADLHTDTRPAGAELVQLRNAASAAAPADPAVQQQGGPVDGEPFFGLDQLRRAVRIVDGEGLVATESTSACQYCSFARVCPAKDEGQTIFSADAS